jgi:hypothetical protein
MAKAYAAILGLLLGGHALVGFFIEGVHLLGVLNVDLVVDLIYITSAAALLFVGLGWASPIVVRGTLLVVGAVLLALGTFGLMDNTVAGLLPTGLTMVDFILLFSAGGFAVLFGLLKGATRPLVTSGEPIN